MLSHLTVLPIISNSGAGKSTLMNMLTFKNRGSLLIQGEIRVNGVLMDKDKMSNLAAYVQQDDLFIGTMTVREHLVFRVSLKREKTDWGVFFLLWVITNAYVCISYFNLIRRSSSFQGCIQLFLFDHCLNLNFYCCYEKNIVPFNHDTMTTLYWMNHLEVQLMCSNLKMIVH